MDARTRATLHKVLSAALVRAAEGDTPVVDAPAPAPTVDAEHSVLDEAALTKVLIKAIAAALSSDDFLSGVNEEFVVALKGAGLKQFSEDEDLVLVSAVGLGDGGLVVDLAGPGVGPTEMMTLLVK